MEPQRHACWLGLIVSLWMFAGCVTAYTPPPLSAAHPQTPSTCSPLSDHARPRSPTDMRRYPHQHLPWTWPNMEDMTLMPLHTKADHRLSGRGRSSRWCRGAVKSLSTTKEIPGFMGAMTMGYKIDPRPS